MGVILILILASLVFALGFLAAFIWSVRSGQFDDTTTPSLRLLMEETVPGNSRSILKDKTQKKS